MAGLRTVGVRLAAEVSGYMNGLRQASRATGELRGEMDRAARGGRLDAVADQATKMGIGLAGAFAVAVGAAAKFDKQMSEVAAVSGATSQQMDQLRKAALKAGADTAFSATEAAKAEAELAKAGLSTSQILGGALSGSLSLAAAGSLDLAESADIAAKTMNVFKLEGKDVGHIADVLAASANKSATDVHEMGEALKQGGLAASAAGMSMEETVGTLSAFADRALSGSDAGTSLKTAIMMLQAPSAKAAGVMQDLGIAAYDANGQFVGTTKLAGNLQQALGGLTQEQRNAALATIFGADGMRAANILYELGEKGIQDYVKAVDDQGAAAEVAAKKMDNLAGDVEKLKGSLETMAIEAGSGANGGLRILAKAAGALVDQVGQLPPAMTSGLTVMAGVTGGALLLGAGMVRVRRSTREMRDELRAIGPAGQRAARGLEVASKWAGRATVAFIALEVVNAVFKAFGPAAADADKLAESLKNLAATGNAAGELSRIFGNDLSRLGREANLATGKFSGFARSTEGLIAPIESINRWLYGTSFSKAAADFESLDAAMAKVVQTSGKADGIKLWNQLLAESGLNADELLKLMPQYAQAMRDAENASGGAAGGIGKVGTEAKTAAQKVEDLKTAFDKLFGERMSYDEALIAYRQGIRDVNKELTEGKRTLDINKQAGADNATAVLEQITRIKDLRQARLDHNETLDVANGKYVKDIDGLRATLLHLGYNKAAVDELIGKYKAIPGEVSTAVSAPGAPTATKQANDFKFAVRSVPPSKTVPFYATVAEAKAAVAALKAKIAELKNKHIYITGSVRWTSSGDLKVPGGTQLKGLDRWGGIHTPTAAMAAGGIVTRAGIYRASNPPLIQFAEPETGGEAYIPRKGDLARSRAIWSHVGENWLGMQPAVGVGSGARVYSPTYNINVPSTVSNPAEVGRQVVEAVRAYEQRSGAGWRK